VPEAESIQRAAQRDGLLESADALMGYDRSAFCRHVKRRGAYAYEYAHGLIAAGKRVRQLSSDRNGLPFIGQDA
jgi:hypothetical protein